MMVDEARDRTNENGKLILQNLMNWKEKKKNMLKCKKDTCNECSYDSFCE
jgi:hypothetical protein